MIRVAPRRMISMATSGKSSTISSLRVSAKNGARTAPAKTVLRDRFVCTIPDGNRYNFFLEQLQRTASNPVGSRTKYRSSAVRNGSGSIEASRNKIIEERIFRHLVGDALKIRDEGP